MALRVNNIILLRALCLRDCMGLSPTIPALYHYVSLSQRWKGISCCLSCGICIACNRATKAHTLHSARAWSVRWLAAYPSFRLLTPSARSQLWPVQQQHCCCLLVVCTQVMCQKGTRQILLVPAHRQHEMSARGLFAASFGMLSSRRPVVADLCAVLWSGLTSWGKVSCSRCPCT